MTHTVFPSRFKQDGGRVQVVPPEMPNVADHRTPFVDAAGVLQHLVFNAEGRPAPFGGMMKGRSLFLVGGGPSAKKVDLSLLQRRGVVSMAMNNAWVMFRPNYWVCVDPPGRFIDTGWKDPGIAKFVPKVHVKSRLGIMKEGKRVDSAYGVHQMPNTWLFLRGNQFNHETFLTEPVVSWGNTRKEPSDSVGVKNSRSVMLSALKLACWMGARTIYLVGVDFAMPQEGDAYAFGEAKSPKARKSNNLMYLKLAKRLEALKPILDGESIKVVNCNAGSELKCFPHMAFESAVEAAAWECEKAVPSKGWYG